MIRLNTRRARAAQIWFVVMLACALASVLSFKHADVPVARLVLPLSPHMAGLGKGLGSAILLSFEAVLFLAIAGLRMVRGHLSRLSKTIALACIASICAYTINASVLKVYFGVEPPFEVMSGAARHAVNFLGGSPDSSFPSGHMSLAGAFAGVWMRHYPKTVPVFAGLLLVAGLLLILGGWHFISDVLTGCFAGVTAGLLAAEIWRVHEEPPVA